jgi:uncharacterized protein (DUF1778 family)
MKAKKKATVDHRHSFLIKVPQSDASVIKKAAARRGMTVTNFVRLAALGTAQKVLAADPAPPPLPEKFLPAADEYAA